MSSPQGLLLLSLGVVLAKPIAPFPPAVIVGFPSFGLIALLSFGTEELLAEAHARQDSPFITAMFFIGILGLLLIEETTGSGASHSRSHHRQARALNGRFESARQRNSRRAGMACSA